MQPVIYSCLPCRQNRWPTMLLPFPLRRVLPVALLAGTLLAAGSQMGAAASPDEIRHAQESLRQKGFDVGRPDGKAGAKTSSAVQAFQRSKGLPVTGELDGETLRLLGVGQPLDAPRSPEAAAPKTTEPPPPAPVPSPAERSTAAPDTPPTSLVPAEASPPDP